MLEVWKDIPDFDGDYQVSNYGQIRSKYKRGARQTKLPEGVFYTLKQDISTPGYPVVSLYKKGVGVKFQIHRLVASLFLKNKEGKKYVNHINGIKIDNRVENLEWCTPTENARHAIRIGLTKKPSVKRKLTDLQAMEIYSCRKMYNDDFLAKKYSIDRSVVCRIKNKKAYQSIIQKYEQQYA